MTHAHANPYGSRAAALVLLMLPVALYLLVFVYPLSSVFTLSVDNSALSSRFQSLSSLGSDAGPDAQAGALLADLEAMEKKQLGEVARMLNQQRSGFRSLIMTTGKVAAEIEPTMAGLIAFDDRWADRNYWAIINDNAAPITWKHYQKALGITVDADGGLSAQAGEDIYVQVMRRTLSITFQVTILTLLVGYPLAYAAANASARVSTFVLAVVLLSFWTSVLVRTTAWVVLLQTNGLVNTLLVNLGFVAEPVQLIFNRFGALVAMTHVLLPFAILPILNVMRTIPASQSDASRSLGAGPIETFLRVYFPQTLRGVAVGGGTVFILSLGFYITPALTGGPEDQMLAYFIADFVNKTLNWGMAAALSVLLLGMVAVLVMLAGLVRWAAARQSRRAV
jgi:putative spermidine/putrescine transport system permease protein